MTDNENYQSDYEEQNLDVEEYDEPRDFDPDLLHYPEEYDDYEELSWDDYEQVDEWPVQDMSIIARLKRFLRSIKIKILYKIGYYDGIPF